MTSTSTRRPDRWLILLTLASLASAGVLGTLFVRTARRAGTYAGEAQRLADRAAKLEAENRELQDRVKMAEDVDTSLMEDVVTELKRGQRQLEDTVARQLSDRAHKAAQASAK